MSGVIKALVNGDARYAIGRVFMGCWGMVNGRLFPFKRKYQLSEI
jgi:hypothetical protein